MIFSHYQYFDELLEKAARSRSRLWRPSRAFPCAPPRSLRPAALRGCCAARRTVRGRERARRRVTAHNAARHPLMAPSLTRLLRWAPALSTGTRWSECPTCVSRAAGWRIPSRTTSRRWSWMTKSPASKASSTPKCCTQPPTRRPRTSTSGSCAHRHAPPSLSLPFFPFTTSFHNFTSRARVSPTCSCAPTTSRCGRCPPR